MKNLILILISILLFSCNKNHINNADKSDIDSLLTANQCQYYDSLGFNSYDNPESMISYFDSSAQLAKLINARSNGTRFLNIASIYVESLSQFDNGLTYLDSATITYQNFGDSIQLANILKYRGFIKAKTGDIDGGLNDISSAIDLFSIKDYEPGIAVTLFDLALINEIQGDYSEAIENLGKAKQFWASISNDSRIFGINTKLINNYLHLDKEATLDSLVNENIAIKEQVVLSEIELNEFELVLKEYSTNN